MTDSGARRAGGRMVTAAADGTPRVWDAAPAPVAPQHAGWVTACRFAAWGEVLSASQDGSLKAWDATTGEARGTRVQRTAPLHDLALIDGVESAGAGAVTADFNGTLQVWDLKSGGERRKLGWLGYDWLCCDVLAGAALVAAGARSGVVRVWDARTGEDRVELRAHAGPVVACRFSPDGCHLLTVSEDQSGKLWRLDGAPGSEPAFAIPVGPKRGWVSPGCAAFSADGGRVAVGERAALRVWDARTGRALAAAPVRDSIPACAFSHDGRWLATASARGLAVWSAGADLEEAARFPTPRPLMSLDWRASDGRLVAGGEDGRLYLLTPCWLEEV